MLLFEVIFFALENIVEGKIISSRFQILGFSIGFDIGGICCGYLWSGLRKGASDKR